MKVLYSARFASIAFLAAALYTWFVMRPGLYGVSDVSIRQTWVLGHLAQWGLGWWLWLIAIFSWMVLLSALGWSYLPAHRFAAMLQSGLMIIATVLAMAGISLWMSVLPTVFGQEDLTGGLTAAIDALALALLGHGCFLGGATTAWMAFDLIRHQVLSRPWLWLVLTSGLCALLAPLLQFNQLLLLVALIGWLVSCLWLSTRRRLPSPFSTWPVTA